MTARMLDGRALAGRLERSLQQEVAAFAAMFGRRPRLMVVLAGDMAASASYVKSKSLAAARVGIDSDVVSVAATASTADLVALVKALASEKHGPADGILVQLPLPPHVDTVAVLDAVPPDRDVDGFHPENAGLLSQGRPRFIPCTAAGVQRMLIDAEIPTAGKHVVTANKALLAVHGTEIFAAASAKGVMVAFEAAVAGGIPIIKALREGLTANRIQWIAGIINGTTNFILSEMRDKGLDFDVVLKEAQRLGYAEADPTFDIEGVDAAHK
ncbi:MAG: homoserine dehydrogenase, partial [Planctomycetota bacterium]